MAKLYIYIHIEIDLCMFYKIIFGTRKFGVEIPNEGLVNFPKRIIKREKDCKLVLRM